MLTLVLTLVPLTEVRYNGSESVTNGEKKLDRKFRLVRRAGMGNCRLVRRAGLIIAWQGRGNKRPLLGYVCVCVCQCVCVCVSVCV